MALKTKGQQMLLRGTTPWTTLQARSTLLPSSVIPLMVILLSLLIPIFAQLSSFPERDQVFGDIVNTPNHNSSSGVPNMPFVAIPRDELVQIGHVCEHDSDCVNFSVCMLEMMEDETTIKICQCDPKEMRKINQTCYVLPGHQCYFPNMNSHGYRFLECWPGSTCRKSVNRSMPDNGFCMCDVAIHGRNLDLEFEMAHCVGSSLSSVFYDLLALSMIFVVYL